MMPSRSTPNLHQTKTNLEFTSTSFQRLSQRTAPTTGGGRDDDSPPPAPPVRDSSSLKSIKYGPGHEKFPSWPVPAAAEIPSRSPSSGGSTRSKSWTDHTNYPKEKVVSYTRPYMKRQHSQYTQQKLKTVMERCEKIPPETFESRLKDKIPERLYLPNVDHDGKPLGDADYSVPSPPEREYSKPHLTQEDLEEYARSYQEPKFNFPPKETNHRLTESGLEEFIEYNRSYEESLFSSISSKQGEGILNHIHHQKQVSYAQSEGYHSYVSSSDSTSTPFLDRLRRDSDAVVVRPQSSTTWDNESSCSRREGRDSVVTNSSGSASSSETLKWHGSMSDVSVASSSCTHLANQSNASSSSSSSSRQLIAHSARVQTPKRHHSESVLYMSKEGQQLNKEGWSEKENRNNSVNKLKLFPVNTYRMQDENGDKKGESGSSGGNSNSKNRLSLSLQSALSVADRISELEKQHKYSYLDPNKKHKVPDPTLKAIQKKALLSFYERHQQNNSSNKNTWRSEPQLTQSQQPMTVVPKPPSPKAKVTLPSRRASSASDYAGNISKRSSLASTLESKTTDHITNGKITPRHQHSNSCGSLSTELMIGPMIVGQAISIDDFIPDKPPERPPKNPNLRAVFPDLFQGQRLPSPDLPPPSPPMVVEHELIENDDPLPPPPPECDSSWQGDITERLKSNVTSSHQTPQPQVQKVTGEAKRSSPSISQNVGIPERSMRYSLIKTRPTDHIIQQVSSKPYQSLPPEMVVKSEAVGFNHRGYPERSSTRYPSTQKLVLNGKVAVSQKVNGLANQHLPEPLKPMHKEEYKKQTSTSPKVDTHRAQRASIAESPRKETPPPLQPRHMRINQSMRAKMTHDHRVRLSPPKEGLRESRSSSLSQSKASYLASRRDRELIVSDSETGSYKRTMSPNGHALSPEVNNELPKNNSRETVWPLIRQSRNGLKCDVVRKPSFNSKSKLKLKDDQCDSKIEDPPRAPSTVLPDVLPVNAKMISRSPQSQYNRPTNLNFSTLNGNGVVKKSPIKSPPSSPPKSPSRSSPFAPLRTTVLSSPSYTIMTSPVNLKPSPPITSTPTSKISSPTSISSLTRDPPHIKASLSPVSSPIKLSPLRCSPPSSSSLLASSPPVLSKSTQKSPPLSPKSSPEPQSPNKPDEYPKVIEGLQLIQRTEVVLRVNTTTSDASSQTEKEELSPTPLPTRKKLQEEIECEKLSEDFVNHLPSSDRLKDILVPGPEHKKPTDYVQGLFRVDVTLKPRPANSPFRSRNNTPSSSPPPSLTTTSSKISCSKLSLPKSASPEPTSPLSCCSTYFTTSEPKAKFLTRFSQDMDQCHVVKDTKDLNQKKDELVSRLDKKLEVLRGEALIVSEECKINDELGINVETYINRVASPQEVSKFRLHVEEVGKITSLLLGLSGRLARAENALMNMPGEHADRRILESKRDKLLEQLEEAKKLKECIDKRSISVSNILYKYLNSEEYADYDHFINMKAKLIMDSKEIGDKIKLGEEQLGALKETLIVTD
ncbi:protein Shroom [Anthonomus grandis grandis]|uniref:protein Shroom n=1 Tax=Anthonomus grandis grandis TaxID=2921223 RepID=UPI002166015B|nr:protein Shroom [Anthonomus grandis grandis]XP_050298761.1 protein Shroom [Anthonomus grandis grandis]